MKGAGHHSDRKVKLPKPESNPIISKPKQVPTTVMTTYRELCPEVPLVKIGPKRMEIAALTQFKGSFESSQNSMIATFGHSIEPGKFQAFRKTRNQLAKS